MSQNKTDSLLSGKSRVQLGIKGEEIAARFLAEEGMIILKRNIYIGHSDIDILAQDGDVLVFAEVRTKSKTDRGMPEESLSAKKLMQMKRTAELYIAFNKYEGPARLDAICLVLGNDSEIIHLEHYKGV